MLIESLIEGFLPNDTGIVCTEDGEYDGSSPGHLGHHITPSSL